MEGIPIPVVFDSGMHYAFHNYGSGGGGTPIFVLYDRYSAFGFLIGDRSAVGTIRTMLYIGRIPDPDSPATGDETKKLSRPYVPVDEFYGDFAKRSDEDYIDYVYRLNQLVEAISDSVGDVHAVYSCNGNFSVRPRWRTYTDQSESATIVRLERLDFGTELQLATYNPVTDEYSCDLDDSGVPLPVPVVKRVGTTVCGNAPESLEKEG